MPEEILDKDLKEALIKTLLNVTNSVKELKEDTIIRLFRAENKIKELETKLVALENKSCCKQ